MVMYEVVAYCLGFWSERELCFCWMDLYITLRIYQRTQLDFSRM